MKIGILGTGRMGKGLARCYAKVGHAVVLGSRDTRRADAEAAAIQEELPEAQVSGADWVSAANACELIVVCVPFGDAAGLVATLADSLEDKIIIDITNPFGAVPVGQISGIEHNAKALGRRARWVAAYKTNFWKTLAHPVDQQGMQRDVFICGDEPDAKRIVRELVESTGFRAVDCGALEVARILDPMVPLMLELDRSCGTNAFSSWKFLTTE